MNPGDQEHQWRAELEVAGERAVRDNINSRGTLVTGGKPSNSSSVSGSEKKMLNEMRSSSNGWREKSGGSITRVGLSTLLLVRSLQR